MIVAKLFQIINFKLKGILQREREKERKRERERERDRQTDRQSDRDREIT